GRAFRSAGDAIVLLGESRDELGGSEYLSVTANHVGGVPPSIDLAAEKALQRFLVAANRDGLLQSAHDCAEGGLAVTLAECSFDTKGIGLDADVPAIAGARDGWALASALFSESASRVVVSVARDRAATLLERARTAGVAAREIGTTGGARIIMTAGGRPVI